MKHTPGPWTAHCDEFDNYVTAKNGNDIAFLPSGEDYECSEDLIRVQANAHLISAAPALLAALELLLDGVKTYSPDFMHGLPKSQYIKAANSAINKAKGTK